MNGTRTTLVRRAAASLALASCLALGLVGVAGAAHPHGAHVNSGRVSHFSYFYPGGHGGYVTAVTTGASVTVAGWNGATTTYTLTSATTYAEGGAAVADTALVVGDRIQILTSSSAPTTATAINIELAELFGTVSAVNGTTITITDGQGFSRTINVESGTTFVQDGQDVTLAAVTVGTKLVARGTIDADGTSLDATTIRLGSAGTVERLKGTLTAVTPSAITIESGSTSTSISYTTETTFHAGGLQLTSANLAVGERVVVVVNSQAATTALSVRITPARITGTVSAVSGATITVTDGQGFSRTIVTDSATAFSKDWQPATLADVTVGSVVAAEGAVDVNGTSLDAFAVSIGVPLSRGWGFGGPCFGEGYVAPAAIGAHVGASVSASGAGRSHHAAFGLVLRGRARR